MGEPSTRTNEIVWLCLAASRIRSTIAGGSTGAGLLALAPTAIVTGPPGWVGQARSTDSDEKVLSLQAASERQDGHHGRDR